MTTTMKQRGIAAKRTSIGLISIQVLFVATLLSCSKDNDTPKPEESTPTGSSISIDSTTTSSGKAEGNTGKAANKEDVLANATFVSTVTIGLGSTSAFPTRS